VQQCQNFIAIKVHRYGHCNSNLAPERHEKSKKRHFNVAKLFVVFNFVTSLNVDAHLSDSFQIKINNAAKRNKTYAEGE